MSEFNLTTNANTARPSQALSRSIPHAAAAAGVESPHGHTFALALSREAGEAGSCSILPRGWSSRVFKRANPNFRVAAGLTLAFARVTVETCFDFSALFGFVQTPRLLEEGLVSGSGSGCSGTSGVVIGYECVYFFVRRWWE
ncbi:hypothetical protein MSAN_01190900 [Mycena sanguinolenta]|uniref:Uncharacterized protein n=1 Tax=Mycena sanguinolenta TaxID=230812 RepID=A0A8H7D468_9AGAR|nr:hypothetical protein MSAN_01190900 [Mycena sanguinolenta]